MSRTGVAVIGHGHAQKTPGEILHKGAAQGEAQALVHGEEQLALATGIARPVLQEARQKAGLQEGKDWGLVSGIVRLTRSGMDRVLDSLGLRESVDLEELARDTDLEAQKKGAPPVVTGKVKRLHLNRHLLEVQFADGSQARLRVRDHKNFKVGMEVPLVREAGSEMYRLGRKEPRSYGRW